MCDDDDDGIYNAFRLNYMPAIKSHSSSPSFFLLFFQPYSKCDLFGLFAIQQACQPHDEWKFSDISVTNVNK